MRYFQNQNKRSYNYQRNNRQPERNVDDNRKFGIQQRKSSNQRLALECGRCGNKSHSSKDWLVTKWKQCNRCGKMGHFGKYCKTKEFTKKHQVRLTDVSSLEEKKNYSSDSSSDDEQDTYVFCLDSKDKPLYAVNIEGTEMKMLVDSGSTLNIIDSFNFRKIIPTPKLKQSSTNIYPYQGNFPLTVIGTFKVMTEAYGKEAKIKYYVVQGRGDPLLGLKSSKKLDLLRLGPTEKTDAVFQIDRSNDTALLPSIGGESATVIKDSHPVEVQRVLDKQENIFKGMGKLKDFKLKLHLDENIAPVQQPIRRLPISHKRKSLRRNH